MNALVRTSEPSGLVVLVRRFPKLSETFVSGEITTLLALGTDLRIVSIERPNDEPRQSEACALMERVSYLEPRPRSLPARLAAWWRRGRRRPLRTLLTLFDCLVEGVDIDALEALESCCRALRASHLHVHCISEPTALARVACRALGLRFSVSAHAKDIYHTGAFALRRRVADAAFVTTCTAYNRDLLRRIAGPWRDRVHLVHHGVDAWRFAPMPRPASVVEPPPLLLAVGRYRRKKGFDLLVDACAILRDRGHRFDCRIVGYGEQRDALAARIARRGLDGVVRLCPPLVHEELAALLRRATLFALPCRREADGDMDGIPNAMLEAMACGLPVIGTRLSGVPEVLRHEREGLLIDPEDVVGLADALERLLGDAALRRRLGARARERVRLGFDWVRNVRRLQVLLRDDEASAPAGPGRASLAPRSVP